MSNAVPTTDAPTRASAFETALFTLRLPGVVLECGASMPFRRVRGWACGPPGTLAWLRANGARVDDGELPTSEAIVPGRPLDDAPPSGGTAPPPAPVVTLVHALTGDMRAGGRGGWWAPVIGPNEPIDPTIHAVVCFNNLGSCYGTSGPADAEFPVRDAETDPAPALPRRGAFELPDGMPATLTSWDQARTHIDALDALCVGTVALLAGGSVGGMQVLCMAALAPERFERALPVAACLSAPAWILAWNHVARQMICRDPAFPRSERGLELARQMAHVTYRAPAGLSARQGREMVTGTDAEWSSRGYYAVQTYLEHQGGKLRSRFDPLAYLALIDAMDHHDVRRRPSWIDPSTPWTLARITAPVLSLYIDSDQLFLPDDGVRIATAIQRAGGRAEARAIESLHGHDAFLIEWQQVRDALRLAWQLTPTPTPDR